MLYFLNYAFEKAECFHSDAFCLFKSLLIRGSTHMFSEGPSLQLSPYPLPLTPSHFLFARNPSLDETLVSFMLLKSILRYVDSCV